jgi:DNA-binding response OmpR family regulator
VVDHPDSRIGIHPQVESSASFFPRMGDRDHKQKDGGQHKKIFHRYLLKPLEKNRARFLCRNLKIQFDKGMDFLYFLTRRPMIYKLIVADGSPSIQKLLQMSFPADDFEIMFFGDGQEVLDSLSQINPDAVLMNLSLPQKDGYDLCEHINKQEKFSQVPIILMKDAFEPLDKERLENLEFHELVQKPFDSEGMVQKVRSTIEEKKIPMTLPEEPVWDEERASGKKVELDEKVRELVKQEILGMERELEKRIKARIITELKMWLINNHKE